MSISVQTLVCDLVEPYNLLKLDKFEKFKKWLGTQILKLYQYKKENALAIQINIEIYNDFKNAFEISWMEYFNDNNIIEAYNDILDDFEMILLFI